MSDVDRQRAQRLMSARGLDAVVLGKPENFAWATGCAPGVAGAPAFGTPAPVCWPLPEVLTIPPHPASTIIVSAPSTAARVARGLRRVMPAIYPSPRRPFSGFRTALRVPCAHGDDVGVP